MVTKGIIEEVNGYKALVRIPKYDETYGSRYGTKKENLPSATYCSIANIEIPIAVNDIVFIDFEDNDLSKPVILGHLYKDGKYSSTPGLSLSTLNTSSTTKLSTSTWIGDVKPNEINCLTGVESNIQLQLDQLKGLIDNTKETIFENQDSEGKEIYLPITGGTITGNLTINGTLFQKGDSYETHTESLYSTNDFITLRENNPLALTADEYSGFRIQNVDGNGKDTLLVVDKDGIARVGIEGNEKGIQALATRNDIMYPQGITVWNSEKNRLDNYTSVTANENQIKIGKCIFRYDADTDSMDFIWE